MRYLIDSDGLIDALRGRQAAVDLLDRLSADGVALSVITLAELLEGAYRAPVSVQQLRAIRQLIAGYVVIDVTNSIAERFAQERARLRDLGMPIADMDLLIVATAMVMGLTLVTRNARDFGRLNDLQLLAWTTT